MPEIMGSGGGLVDYDQDGWLDIILVRGGNFPGRVPIDEPALVLYRNNGFPSGDSQTDTQRFPTFEDHTLASGLGEVRAYGFGVAAADLDNDGDEDILLTTLQRNLLFRNENGVFEEISEDSGLDDVQRWSTSALFFDADRDGHLDLYIANYLHWSPDIDIPCMDTGSRDYCNPLNYRGEEDSYYHNNGDGTFSNRTVEAGFSNRPLPRAGKGLGVVELDYNQDNWPDVYVANDGQPNFLFKNNQDGTFSEIGVTSGVAFDQNGTTRAGMGVDAGVIDSTGKVSLLVGNFSEEMVGLWRHEENDLFSDRAAASRIGYHTLSTLTFGLRLFDADLDTDLDLLLANGHVMKYIAQQQLGVTFEQQPQFFSNRGDGTFERITDPDGPLHQSMVARGLAAGDIDRDGDVDVLLTENNGPAHVWRNDLKDAFFLRVRLQGTRSNRDALGARLRAHIPDLVMERRVHTGASYLSQSEKTVTFGLGSHREVSVLEVLWPSGRTDTFQNVAGNQEILLVEGNHDLVPLQIP